jgi:ribosome-associated protein
MIIVSGTSSRHVISIAEKLVYVVKREVGLRIKTEGMGNADWILIDCGDVIIHVFREEVREFYQLERLWQQNPITQSDLENA